MVELCFCIVMYDNYAFSIWNKANDNFGRKTIFFVKAKKYSSI